MRLKLKKSILSAALLFIGFTLFSCVEEPYVEPVKETFSEIRVLNLSINVPNMKVTIDGAQPNAGLSGMAIPSTTSYFDINPGKRVFSVYDENDNLLVTTNIEITSWERMTIIFAGFFSTDELQNTFGNFEIPEGEVYKTSSPDPAGTSYSYAVNAVTDYDTLSSREFRTGLIPAGAAPVFMGSVAYSGASGVDSLAPAGYSFYYASDLDGDSTVVSSTDGWTGTVGPDLRYYFFLYGPPNDVKVYVNEVVPQPARNRG